MKKDKNIVCVIQFFYFVPAKKHQKNCYFQWHNEREKNLMIVGEKNLFFFCFFDGLFGNFPEIWRFCCRGTIEELLFLLHSSFLRARQKLLRGLGGFFIKRFYRLFPLKFKNGKVVRE